MDTTTDSPRSVGNGRYELVDVLGEGGMATVWRCRDTRKDVELAVKILHKEVAERKSYRSRFLTEARTMARLTHPNILQVFEVGEEEGRYWFTMEIVEGGALIDILEQKGRVAPLEALDITFQTLQALQAAHLEGVVHRDIKPDNVLLAHDGTVKLSDFGIARIRNERVDHRTRTGVAMGTVGYMAPEQRENARGVGPAADLYAVGATLYALVTGCEPPDLFASHLDPKLLEGVPPAIRDVIRNATGYRPEKRYQHARAMAVDVARAYDAIARGRGLHEVSGTWLARFDHYTVHRMRRPEGSPAAPPPPADDDLPPMKEASPWESLEGLASAEVAEAVRRATEDGEARRSARRKVTIVGQIPTVGVAALVAIGVAALALAAWYMVSTGAAAGPSACLGTWQGTMNGPTGTTGLVLDLEPAVLGGIHGYAATTSMGHEVRTRVAGRCEGGVLDLHEVNDRADRGRYSGQVRDDAVSGTWTPLQGEGDLAFVLTRSGS